MASVYLINKIIAQGEKVQALQEENTDQVFEVKSLFIPA